MRRITVPVLLWFLLNFAAHTVSASAFDGTHETSYEIHFGIISTLITIDAEINGISGYLCIDTGIDGLVIRDTYFKTRGRTTAFAGSNGNSVKSGYTQATVKFAGIEQEYAHACVINLDALIPNDSTRVLGLIGWSAFTGFELQIDFRNRLLRLFPLNNHNSGNESTRPMRYPLKTIPIRFKGPWPYIDATIGNETLQLVLDTGASINVIHSRLYKKLSPFCHFLQMITLRNWDSESSEVPLTEVSQIFLGDFQLKTMNTTWYNLSSLNAEFEGPHLDGVLGQEIMKQYLLEINFDSRELKLYAYDPQTGE
jgi:hypothetical protein